MDGRVPYDPDRSGRQAVTRSRDGALAGGLGVEGLDSAGKAGDDAPGGVVLSDLLVAAVQVSVHDSVTLLRDRGPGLLEDVDEDGTEDGEGAVSGRSRTDAG